MYRRNQIQKEIFREQAKLKEKMWKLKQDLKYQLYCEEFESNLFQTFPLDVKILIYKDVISGFLHYGGFQKCFDFYIGGGHLYTCVDTRNQLKNHHSFQGWIFRNRKTIDRLDYFCFDILNTQNIKRFSKKNNAEYTTKNFRKRLLLK